MIPINMPRPGRPPSATVILVGIGKCGVSMPATVHEKMGKPTYLETYIDGDDLVLIPREVNGLNHSKRLTLTNTNRAFFSNRSIIRVCHPGHFLFSLSRSLVLRVKNCVKKQDIGDAKPSRFSHPKTVLHRAASIRIHKKEDDENIIDEKRYSKSGVLKSDQDRG